MSEKEEKEDEKEPTDEELARAWIEGQKKAKREFSIGAYQRYWREQERKELERDLEEARRIGEEEAAREGRKRETEKRKEEAEKEEKSKV